jgi:pimeloyl-ACP methyl ester carboxylesterase
MRARALLAVLMVAGCAAAPATAAPRTATTDPTATLAGTPSPPASPTPTPKPSPRPRPATTTATTQPTFSAVVSADGVRQWLHCSGRGPLTLVVVPGLGTAATAWSPVLGQLQQLLRTCIYDRPGLGLSPARPNTRQVIDAGMLAGELWALLQTAGEHGPYVVLGHSFGGLVARAFIAAHRASVRGVLLAESVTPFDPAAGPNWTEAGHAIDLHASSVATDDGPQLGSIPLLVLSASRPDENHLGGPTYGQPAWMTTLWI